MSRNLLHKTKLEDFKAWVDARGLRHRPGRGDFQVLQVCKDGALWLCVFSRHEMPEHYTTDYRLDNLVRQFCREAKVYNAELTGAPTGVSG